MWNVLIMLVALKISIPTPIGVAWEAFIEGLQTIVTGATNRPSDFEGCEARIGFAK